MLLRRSSLTTTKHFVYCPSMKMSKANLPKPTEGELELLRVLWAKGSATVRELHEAVSQERALGLHHGVEVAANHDREGSGAAQQRLAEPISIAPRQARKKPRASS